METKLGEWLESINAFWCGGNGMECVARKGALEVLVYDCDRHPCPPNYVVLLGQGRRIRTLDDFNEALTSGVRMKATYETVGTGAFGD